MEQFLNQLRPTLEIIVFVTINAVIIAGALFLAFRSRRAALNDWRRLAERLGFEFKPGSFMTQPALEGSFRRRQSSITTFTQSTGRSSVTYTRISLVLLRVSTGSLTITPEGPLSGVGKALGMQDVQIGSERFDKSFMVKSQPPELALSVLGDPMLQDSLIRLREKRGSLDIQVKSHLLTYTTLGFLKEFDLVEELLNTLSDLADRLDGGGK